MVLDSLDPGWEKENVGFGFVGEARLVADKCCCWTNVFVVVPVPVPPVVVESSCTACGTAESEVWPAGVEVGLSIPVPIPIRDGSRSR